MRLIAAVLLSLVMLVPTREEARPFSPKHSLRFDDIKYMLAYYESRNGESRVGVNPNGTRDYGIYQLNEENFDPEKSGEELAIAFDSIFAAHGVGRNLQLRIKVATHDDALNEDLARALYERRGIKQWYTYRMLRKHFDLSLLDQGAR